MNIFFSIRLVSIIAHVSSKHATFVIFTKKFFRNATDSNQNKLIYNELLTVVQYKTSKSVNLGNKEAPPVYF